MEKKMENELETGFIYMLPTKNNLGNVYPDKPLSGSLQNETVQHPGLKLGVGYLGFHLQPIPLHPRPFTGEPEAQALEP